MYEFRKIEFDTVNFRAQECLLLLSMPRHKYTQNAYTYYYHVCTRIQA